MLSGVHVVDRSAAERLVREEKEQQRKEKKEKKRHKKEKKTKQKSGRRHAASDSDGGGGSSSDGGGAAPGRRLRREQWDDPEDSDSGSEGEGAGQLGAARGGGGGGGDDAGAGLQREDWMTKPQARQKTDAQLAAEEEERERAEEEARKRDPDRPFVSERELNPYLKNGGTGQPPQGEGAAAAAPVRAAGVGDGGASWRLKALKRAQQQAKEEGKKMNDIVAERWGSLAELTGGLTEGRRAAHGNAHLHAARDRRAADPDFDRRQQERRRMREGTEGGESEERGRESNRDTPAAYLSEMRSGRSQMQRPKEAASLSWRRGGDRDRRRDDRREGEREERRQADERRDDRREQRRDGDRGRDGEGARERGGGQRGGSWRDRPPQDPLGRRGDSDALKAAAAELNQFSGDGSFLEQFQRLQAEGEAQQAQQGDEEARPAGGAEVQPSASSGSEGEDERHREEAQQGQRQSMAAAMAAERASLGSRPPALAAGAAEAAGEPASGGRGGAEERPQPSSGEQRRPVGNLSAAAMLKARLTGKASPAEAVPPAQAAPAAAAAAAGTEEGGPRQETVVLPQINARGRAVPGAFGREEAGTNMADGGRRQKRTQRYEGGERSRYFADDDATDLQTLAKRTKHGDEGDIDRRLAAGIMRSQRYKEKDFDADAEYDHDAGLEMLDKRTGRKATKERESQREKQRQIREYNKMTSALDQCRLCFSSSHRPRQLTLAIGQSTYLALPARGRLVPGHCVIVPAEHVPSTRQVDEQVWNEIRNFKKCLIQMFMKQGQEVIFFETAVQLGSMRSHAVVDCVPVPPAAAAKAPMYFKKAVDDATSEWAQHHAKRFIDTKAKGLRGCIPPNFPYLHVEFGIADGFVHVIDDEANFDRALARSVMIGLLGLPQEDMHRRARAKNPTIQQQWADEFRKQFAPYDWTKMLE
ncbi:hypothetical protein ABPG75_002627 [Micractinium tetrahymenae]